MLESESIPEEKSLAPKSKYVKNILNKHPQGTRMEDLLFATLFKDI